MIVRKCRDFKGFHHLIERRVDSFSFDNLFGTFLIIQSVEAKVRDNEFSPLWRHSKTRRSVSHRLKLSSGFWRYVRNSGIRKTYILTDLRSLQTPWMPTALIYMPFQPGTKS